MIIEAPVLRFSGLVQGRADGVDITLNLTNRSKSTWTDARALVCVAATDSRDPWPFPLSGQERVRAEVDGELRSLGELRSDSGDPNYVELEGASAPVTELSSVDGRLTLALGMDRSDVVGGNANAGICLHARPRMGDVLPGQTATVRGRLLLSASTPTELFAMDWAPAPPSPERQPFADPWVLPCSEEGALRREEARPRIPVDAAGAGSVPP